MPVMHVLAGPNGAGKSTFVDRVLLPTTGLPFINADVIAAERWPGKELESAVPASQAAAHERERMLGRRDSFITETVFSHPSKVELIERASALGYEVTLHVILIPPDLARPRVESRVGLGGHDVPADRIALRYERLWGLVAQARSTADYTKFYDNSNAADAFRQVASFVQGHLVGHADWPAWTPAALLT